MTLCLPLFSQILLLPLSFPLFLAVPWFTPHLHCINLRTFSLCEWLGQRLRQLLVAEEKRLHCAVMSHRVCVSRAESGAAVQLCLWCRGKSLTQSGHARVWSQGLPWLFVSSSPSHTSSPLSAFPRCFQVIESRLRCSLTAAAELLCQPEMRIFSPCLSAQWQMHMWWRVAEVIFIHTACLWACFCISSANKGSWALNYNELTMPFGFEMVFLQHLQLIKQFQTCMNDDVITLGINVRSS